MPELNIKVTADTAQARANLKSFSGSFTEMKSAIDLTVGALKTIGQAAGTALKLGKEGAQLKDLHASLERLGEAASVGADLLGRLEKAAGNTIDDFDLAGSTIRLLTGETGKFATALANAAPQLVTIARAAVKLNPTLGTTAQAYEAITRAIETGQTRALKNYGIILGDVENKQDALNQILAQGGILIDQVGGDVLTASDSFNQFEQSVDNLKDSLQLLAANSGATETVVGGLTDEFTLINTLIEAQAAGVITTGEAWGKYAEVTASVGQIDEARAQVISDLNELIVTGTATTLAFSDAQQDHTTHTQDLTEALKGTWGEARNYAEELQAVVDRENEATEASDAYAERLKKVNDQSALLIENSQNAAPKLEELNDILNQDVGSVLDNLLSDIDFFLASGGRDFVAEYENIMQVLAEKVDAADTSPGQAAIAMQDAREAAAELLVDYGLVQVELGKETEIGLATSLSEKLGVSIEDAQSLIEDFSANADEVFGVERAFLLDTASLEDLHTKLSEAEGQALLAEEGIENMLETAGVEVDGDGFDGLIDGLANVTTNANKAAGALANLQKVVNSTDTSNAEDYIAESPPPLGEGLDYIANAIPAVISGFNSLASAIDGIGGSGTGGGLLDLTSLFEAIISGVQEASAETEELTDDLLGVSDALFDAANAFGGLADFAADLFEEQTLDPLKTQLEGIDAQIAAIMEGQIVDMYELSRLTAERADVAREIAEQEERILKLQEQQQKIDFLSQQFELIKFLQENGLDAASILSGVSLGANADPAALLDAMSKALEQILAKLGGELGGLGFQHGANFVVPPGYPGDSFGPMWATSGEHVSVSNGGGGGNGQVVINMAGAIIMSQAEADRMMKQALDRAGGRADIYRRGG